MLKVKITVRRVNGSPVVTSVRDHDIKDCADRIISIYQPPSLSASRVYVLKMLKSRVLTKKG